MKHGKTLFLLTFIFAAAAAFAGEALPAEAADGEAKKVVLSAEMIRERLK